MAQVTLTISGDARPLVAALKALMDRPNWASAEVRAEVAQLLSGGDDPGQSLFTVEVDHGAAPADQLLVRFEPSAGLRRVLVLAGVDLEDAILTAARAPAVVMPKGVA